MVFNKCVRSGLVGACGICVLRNLMRVHLFLQTVSLGSEGRCKQPSSPGWVPGPGALSESLQFWFLTLVLSIVGPRVASLVVLEFCLRVASARFTGGPESLSSNPQLLLVQCQFSLGCALICGLNYLHEGAPHRTLSLVLVVGVSWLLSRLTGRLWGHVLRLYPLHSSQRYCGVCILLLTSGRALLPLLHRALGLTFAVGAVAAFATVNHHFLSAAEAMRFYTPLTICYSLLVFYSQDQQCRPGGELLLNTVVVRLGALLVLMLTVGRWADVLHVLMAFLGEFGCLFPSLNLLEPLLQVRETSKHCSPL